jgi:alcohol dehydrogenase
MPDTVLRLDPEIIIGMDTVNRAGTILSRRRNKILIAAEQGLYEYHHIERLVKILEDAGLETILFDEIPAMATADIAEQVASLAHGARCDMIAGLGGTKTQYTAKLASVLACSSYRLFDLLDGERENSSFLPYAALPTSGGDPFLFSDYLVAVDPRDRHVKLIKCPRGLCEAVILDPGLSEPLSDKYSSTAVFDGLLLSLEAYCSAKASFLSDALLEQAISLYSGMMHSYAVNAVLDFPAVSVNAGFLMSLGASASTPGIGAALAYALNGKFPVARPWCATVILPYIMEKLISARPEKMAKAAVLMGEKAEGVAIGEAANMAVGVIRRRMGQLGAPARLRDFNLSLDRMVPAAEAARNLEFVANSSWTVASEDAYDILKQAF